MDFVVDLVNGWSTTARRAAQELDEPFAKFERIADVHGLAASAFGLDLRDDDLVRVADALYLSFSASDDEQAADHLNTLLAETRPSPRLAHVRGQLVDSWAVHAGRQALLASCVLALRQCLIDQGNGRRLGVCSGIKCADVYVDASPAGRKRFCDITCQNRARVTAFRRARGAMDRVGAQT